METPRPSRPTSPFPPLRLLAVVAAAVLTVQGAMLLFDRLALPPHFSLFVETALHVLILFLLLFFLFRPGPAATIRGQGNTKGALAAQRDLFKDILDSISSGVYVTNRFDTIFLANRTMCRLSGLPPAKIEGAGILTDFPERTLRYFLPYYLRAKGSLVPTRYEGLRFRSPGGRESFQSGWLIPRVRDGKYDGMICTVEDVTSNRTTRAALHASEQRYQDLFEHANDAIFIVDNALRYVDVNKKAVELFGYSREEFLAMRVTDVIPPEQLPRSEAEFAKLRTNGRYDRFIGKQRTRDGRWLDIEISASAIIESGRMVGSREIVRDITERKQIEEQLRQSQKMEAIGTLAGGIAHDFNNILYAIRGYTELSLAETAKNSPVHENLQEIARSTRRAADLVKQILTFSRKGAEEKQPLRLEPVVKEALKLIRGTLPSTIDIRQELDRRCPPIQADLTQIHQVVINLCANAADAMEGGGVLTVRLAEATVGPAHARRAEGVHPGSYVRLSVSDTGHGMDQATMQRIFEPYFTTKGPGKGTGLGLATVHGIVSNHQGVIVPRSAPGEGTTFDLYFPALPAEETTEGEADQGATLPPVTGHVLVVDDEQSIVRIAERALQLLGCQVTCFTSSSAALTAFQNTPHAFDAVLTDQTMPHLTGLELARQMMEIRPDLPIILTTGYSAAVNAEQAKAAGIRAFLMKPLSLEDLAQALHQALQ